MPKYTKVFTSHLETTLQRCWDFHNDASALKILTPPDQEITIISEDNRIYDGATHIIEAKKFGRRIRWVARILNVNPPHSFTDIAIKSPFKTWEHKHEFIEKEGIVTIRDTITYEPKGGILGAVANSVKIDEEIEKLFKYRHRTLREFLQPNAAVINEELIGTGGDGLTTSLGD